MSWASTARSPAGRACCTTSARRWTTRPEGGHPQIGMEFLRRFNEPEAVLNAALGHHGDVPATTPYTPIIMAADAISASRPARVARSLERYVKRLQDLEELAIDASKASARPTPSRPAARCA